MEITLNRPRLTNWCGDCDGPCAIIYCAYELANACEACHTWLGCPCHD